MTIPDKRHEEPATTVDILPLRSCNSGMYNLGAIELTPEFLWYNTLELIDSMDKQQNSIDWCQHCADTPPDKRVYLPHDWTTYDPIPDNVTRHYTVREGYTFVLVGGPHGRRIEVVA